MCVFYSLRAFRVTTSRFTFCTVICGSRNRRQTAVVLSLWVLFQQVNTPVTVIVIFTARVAHLGTFPDIKRRDIPTEAHVRRLDGWRWVYLQLRFEIKNILVLFGVWFISWPQFRLKQSHDVEHFQLQCWWAPSPNTVWLVISRFVHNGPLNVDLFFMVMLMGCCCQGTDHYILFHPLEKQWWWNFRAIEIIGVPVAMVVP